MQRKIIATTLIGLIAGINLPAYAADENNQKKIASAATRQNSAATLLQAACRGTLERQRIQHITPVEHDTSIQCFTPMQCVAHLQHGGPMRQIEIDVATLIQAGIRGAVTRKNHQNANAVDQYGDTPLTMAVRADKVEKIRELIAAKANVNVANDLKITSLMGAAYTGHTEIARILIAEKANVNAADRYNVTPLMIATAGGHVEIVRMLIAEKVNVNAANRDGATALMVAAENGYNKILSMLIKANANVNSINNNTNTSLIIAAEKGHTKIVRMLIAAGAQVNTIGPNGGTPLIFAAQDGHVDVVRLLIKARANVNHSVENGFTPLMFAAQNGYTEIARRLLAAGAQVNIVDSIDRTPLRLAAENGHIEIVKMLIAAGANIDDFDQYWVTPLFMAAQNGHIEVVRMLIVAGADINESNLAHNTPLLVATYQGHTEIVRMLIDAQADVNHNNLDNNTPLRVAAHNGNTEITQILINAKTNVNDDNLAGVTSSMLAVKSANTKIILLLIVAGANIDVTILMLPNIIEIIQSTIELFRSQLAEQHPENLMEFLASDLEQFGQNSEDATLESMSNAFIQVGEIITRDMSIEDRNNFRAGCRLFRKAASNGKNILARSKKIELFIKFITQLRQQIISLKEKYTGDEQVINVAEKVVALLDQELQRGHCAHRQETQNTDQVAQAAPATTCCITMQQAGPDAAFENTQVACATLNAERALRAQQETEYEQSLVIDQRKAALKEQIAKLNQQAHAFMTEYDVHTAPLEIRQQAVAILADIIAARTELINFIQATQICHEVFSQAIAAQLAEQNEACINEQAQLEMIKNAIDSYAPTREEIRAAREQYYGNGKGKGPA